TGKGGRRAPRRSFLPNGRGCLLCHTAHADFSVHTSIIEPEYPPRREPRRCHIVVHLTTTMSHRRGSAARGAGAVVKGAPAGTWAGLTGGPPGMRVGSRPSCRRQDPAGPLGPRTPGGGCETRGQWVGAGRA